MDLKKLFDKFVTRISSMTDSDIQQSIQKAIENSSESHILDEYNY